MNATSKPTPSQRRASRAAKPLTVRLSLRFSVGERFQIAYMRDVLEGPKSVAQWNAAPRLATRQELLDEVTRAMRGQGLRNGDDTGNIEQDGRILMDDVDDEETVGNG